MNFSIFYFNIFFTFFVSLTQLCVFGVNGECLLGYPVTERRDCYPWSEGRSRETCEKRGCVWCEDGEDEGLYPACFYNDWVCPSTIVERNRIACGGGDVDRSGCLEAGCSWCESVSADTPKCFHDATVSMGGEICPEDIPISERIDCQPDVDEPALDVCLARGCFWCNSSDIDPGAPVCFSPRETGYRVLTVEETPDGLLINLERVNTPSWFGGDIQNVQVHVEYQSDDRLRIKVTDPQNNRFVVPGPLQPIEPSQTQRKNLKYEVEVVEEPVFGIRVTRPETGATIFDTTIGGFQFADQFLQIATRLDTDNLYGFGEHLHRNIKHDMKWKSWGMYTRDHVVTTDANLYGSQPFYLNLERSGKAHGVLFYNANAQDVTLMPAPALTYRTIGGILDIYLFFGPSPDNVVQQYNQLVGFPVMIPYWCLGFQLSRWGYKDLEHMKEVVGRMRAYNIPHDVQYADIDYMDGYRDFTLDQIKFGGLPDYVEELHSEGTKFIIIVDPGISNQQPEGNYSAFDDGQRLDVWVKLQDGQTPAEGVVWPGRLFFPDYTNPITGSWWINHTVEYKKVLDYDALWIDMNEPSSFEFGNCSDNQWNYPPYVPKLSGRALPRQTLCPDTKHKLGDHYNVHSLYGISMAQHTVTAVRQATGKRSLVFSRSTFPGSGRYAQHWLGDNFSQWSNIRWSVIGVLEFNMFGYPFVGPDICGFAGPATQQLCQRWQQVGAFFPLSRNHNAQLMPDQDPGMWPEVARVTRETLEIRYTLLPYLYTLFYRAHTTGSTVVRTLLFEFSDDSNTYAINDQFLWGEAFMIAPVLDQNVLSLEVYFPDAVWYSYYDGGEILARGSNMTVRTPLDFIPLYIRGGYVLPTQQPDNCTANSRKNPMGLIVALDEDGTAQGDLFWDDGDSQDTIELGEYLYMQYTVSNGELRSAIVHSTGYYDMRLDDIRLMGVGKIINTVIVKGQRHDSWVQDPDTMQVQMSDLNLITADIFTISWT